MEIDHFNHVRAYIKIQDGCNNFCTYCIIPYLRGNLRCKNYDIVLDEAKILVKNGHQEITLTGIHTGTYSSNNHDLCDLINDLSKIEGLKRIRLSSIEITEIDNPKFYELLRNNSVLCDNMHIPIQAGSNAILKRMNRKYDLDYFKKVIAKIRTIRPDIYLSTDCMVGFPYETKELFLTTLETCRKLNFSKIHVFPYSVRKGTPAAKMPEQVSQGEKHCRARELIKLSDELERKYNNSFIGQTKSVLIEECHDGYSIGHTSNLLRLKIPKEYPINSIVDVKIEASYYE
jgi:threonylcarbamoyladenosine tRNA methylthiotransferase MtaB